MADEPNNDMEKILRAYTEARRKGADLPLHPATRKMLHAEVARRYKATGGAAPRYWSRLRGFWPQLAFGSGLCAILIVAVLSLRQPPQTKAPERAKQEKLSETPPTNERYIRESVAPPQVKQAIAPEQQVERFGRNAANVPVAPQASAAAPVDALNSKENRRAGEEEVLRRDRGLETPQLQTADKEIEQVVRLKDATTTRNLSQKAEDSKQFDFRSAQTPVGRSYQISRASAGTGGARGDAAMTSTKLAAANEMTNLGAALRTKFVEVPNAASAANLATANAVMNSFQFEQQGDDLRIVDRDGSVYYGQLSPEAPAQANAGVQPLPTQPNALSYGETPGGVATFGFNSPNTAVYSLKAQGTNLTLAKPVTFEGRFLERTNVAALGVTPAKLDAAVASKRAETFNLSKARKAIVGQATVGQTNQFPVNAVSVDPAN